MKETLPLKHINEQYNQKLVDQERERIHREILSKVAHDLKTPLVSMVGSLEVYEMMKDKLSPERQETLIHVALQEAYRLDQFITNILDMAKLERGVIKPKLSLVDIGALMKDCQKKFAVRLDAGEIYISSSENLNIVTDRDLLSRAIGVVLDNAISYGGQEPLITLSYGVEGDQAHISIRDTGPGIPVEHLEDAFAKYTRFPREGEAHNGLGIGLAVGRAIMRLLGGDMTATNHPPEGGAILTLRIPLKKE